jgi:hypothetical protein
MFRSLSWSRIIPTLALVLGAVGFGQSGGQGQGQGQGERESDPERLAAWLEIAVLRGDTGRITPARVYLFKDGNPFRLSPVDVLLPLRVDRFYRDRLWRRPPELTDAHGQPPRARARTLEVTNDGESHFILLDGEGRYELPAGNYRVEAYHGLRWEPVAEDFVLKAGERRRVSLTLRPLDTGEGSGRGWVSGDDHIHLTRAAEDDEVFLRWLEADDLSVGNFLQLQRQVDAAVQYAFGREGEVTAPGRSIRSGQESRSEFYGHINLLGPSRLIRPVSAGTMYANTPEAYPFPNVLFAQGRSLGAAVGYAHFDGSMPHSALPMDLALGAIDFIEVFQFGALKAEPWYELLNAGFRVTGIAGSDFPANLGRFKPWPRAIPLLGPERTLVKVDGDGEEKPQAEANTGRSAYDRWVEGVKKGQAVVSNGPLLDLVVDGEGPGAVRDWQGESKSIRGEAHASFHRPLELLEIVVNGQVVATRAGDGRQKELHLPFEIPVNESVWVAARVLGQRVASANEPEIQAHTNPVYVLRDRRPVHIKSAREAVAARWRRELDYYRGTNLTFADPKQRQELETALERATRILENEPQPWP